MEICSRLVVGGVLAREMPILSKITFSAWNLTLEVLGNCSILTDGFCCEARAGFVTKLVVRGRN